jgi:NADH-quinone oxidoreductase subunit N
MEYIMPLWPAYPELFLLVMACVILIVDLFVSDDNRIVTYGLTQFTLAGCALLTFFTGNPEPVYTFSWSMPVPTMRHAACSAASSSPLRYSPRWA